MKKAAEEGWKKLRKKSGRKAEEKIVEKVASQSAKRSVSVQKRIDDAADLLLDKVEQAIKELDMHLVTHTTKTKMVEYTDAHKPKKETVEETVRVIETASLIDRRGLQQITSALKDIREIKGIMSKLDQQEKQARIDSLRKQADADKTKDKTITVVLGNAKDYVG